MDVPSRSSVKRVVLTASCACVLKPGIIGKWDETSWNEPSILEVQEKGTKAPGIAMYRASKTLAEKGTPDILRDSCFACGDSRYSVVAAWEFVETHKGEIGWDLAVLNPPFVRRVSIPLDILPTHSVNLPPGVWRRSL